MRVTGLRNFTRALIAKSVGADDPAAVARARWGPAAGVTELLEKTAIGGLTSGDPMSTAGRGDDEFFSSVLQASIFGSLKYRHVPFHLRLLKMTTAARGYWVAQGDAIPLSKQTLEGASLQPRKVGAIIVSTMEALKTANPLAEDRLEGDLRNALVGALDGAFLDAANAGSAAMPASIAYGASSTASSGSPATDIATLIENFGGDLAQAVFVTDPLTAARIAMARDSGGSFAFPDAGVRGGSILGIPLVVSAGSPHGTSGGQLALVDPSGIAAQVEAIEVARSTQATLEMADDPTGNTVVPTAMAKTMVNLFQSDSVAFKAVIYCNWDVQRSGAVAVITGAAYATSQP